MHAGMREARDWVVLVPGFTGSKEDFIALLPILAEAGMGAVALDHLGQFESEGSDRPEDYAMDRLAEDLAAVTQAAADEFGRRDRPHLLGHSFGGLIAQEAVAAGHVRPASLLLLCTGPGALPQDRWGELPDLVAALDEHDLATIWRIMRDLDEPGSWSGISPDVASFLERRWHANSPVHMRECALLLMTAASVTDRLAPVVAGGLPTTVVWGSEDDAWPIESQSRLARELGAEAVELLGLGHSPNAEDPARAAAALLLACRPTG